MKNFFWPMRFKLRTFLIVFTIWAIAFGWYINRANQQRKAVQWILAHDGLVYYDFQVNVAGNPMVSFDDEGNLIDRPLWVPTWLLNNFDIHYFSDIEIVSFVESPLETRRAIKDLSHLSTLRRLKVLHLGYTSVTDLEPIAGMQSLLSLDLCATPIVDTTPLTKLPSLQFLSLDATSVDLVDVERIQRAIPECDISAIHLGDF